MKVILKDNVIYAFSPGMKPVAHVHAGETVQFETLDALGGQIQNEEDVMNLDFSKVNPATGPIYVEGARKGQTLVVEILDINISSDRGVIVAEEGFGVLRDVVKGFRAKILPIRDGCVIFDGLSIPIKPMIGVIGVAPEREEFPTGTAHKHGGNMDTKEITVKSRIHLPVFQDGALLALGDVHAVMGDGEVCVSACEVPATVTAKIEVEDRTIDWPIVETEEHVCVIVSLPELKDALEEATRVAVKMLSEARKISFEEAYMLASLIVDVGVSQLVDPNLTAKAKIPKRYLA
ncbi:MAG: Acetamidase/Formamidase [Thermotoga sp. 50_1627]|uniref:acetamidase/formamidase family protein n=1 Tax=Pseudothermotoga sp. TaxID=2033661 RepID=UPI00076D1E3C|nr:MAG: Acetamidase/Formamidase [Thermotoga sp. 50_64]KUK24156.1 MAG: Acetamidase/Formamidase [Thermotoga sp. 50_1627]MDK2923918.1 amidase [Pseudothermotoga sp.]